MNLKLFNVLISLFAFFGTVAFGGYTLDEFLIITDSLIIVWAVTHYALMKLGNETRGSHSVMAVGFIMLFWIAYTTKLPIAMHFPSVFWVVPDLVTETGLRRQIPFAFFVAALGYTVLLLTVVSAPAPRQIDWQIRHFRPGIPGLLFLSLFALAFKYILKDVYSLGIPTVEPVDFGIPMLTGFTTLMIEIGVLILVNMLLFAAFYTAQSWLLACGMMAAFGNAGIELIFGSKEMIMYQLVITFSYIFIFYKFPPLGKERPIRRKSLILLSFTTIISVITIAFYKFFNLFRYARFAEDLDVVSAFYLVVSDRGAETASSFLGLWNRMNGLELLSAVIANRNLFGEFDLLNILGGSITERFTYLIVGTTEANVRFGLTIFGYFYIASGIVGVIVGIFTISILFIFMQNLILKAKVNNHTRLAVLPILWIMIVKVLLGGGNVILVVKEFFVFLLAFWILANLFFRSSEGSTLSVRQAPPQASA